MTERVVTVIPLQEAEALRVFAPLVPFGKIIGQEVRQIVESLQKKIHHKTRIEDDAQPLLKGATGSPFSAAATSPGKGSTKAIKKIYEALLKEDCRAS